MAPRKGIQTAFDFPKRGGARKGAGRKRKDQSSDKRVAHTARPKLDGRTPVHVTLRVRRDVPNLRTQVCMAVVFRVFAAARSRLGMRLAQWSVQRDHLHLIVEPESEEALSRGMQGLKIRFARALNRALGRGGSVFTDRYHAAPLRSPKQVRNCLVYVLFNSRHHGSRDAAAVPMLDACSSSPCFDGWSRPRAPTEGRWGDTVAPPVTWLLRAGWKRHGLINPEEVPCAA